MAEKTKDHTSHPSLDNLTDFDDRELHQTMQEFLQEEKKSNTNIWNFATIAGIAMFFVAMIYLIQSVGLAVGPDVSGLIEAMPIIGGILVTLVGFGFLVGDRPKKKSKKERKQSRRRFEEYDFEYETDEEPGLENNLEDRFKKGKRRRTRSGSFDYDKYALRHSKKLYKSRTDKKWAGVCGGLAKYFGISPTVIRLLFIITFFAGSGTSLLVYFALAVALDKEPPELMDDFDF